MLLTFRKSFSMAGFSDKNLAILLRRRAWSQLRPGMTMVFFRRALVLSLILTVTSCLQCRSLSLLVQFLHLAGMDFLASTTDLWYFPVSIFDMDLQETLPALGSRALIELQQDIAGLLSSLACRKIPCTLLHLTIF